MHQTSLISITKSIRSIFSFYLLLPLTILDVIGSYIHFFHLPSWKPHPLGLPSSYFNWLILLSPLGCFLLIFLTSEHLSAPGLTRRIYSTQAGFTRLKVKLLKHSEPARGQNQLRYRQKSGCPAVRIKLCLQVDTYMLSSSGKRNGMLPCILN